MITLRNMTSFLDRELNINAFCDDSHNGLQVECSGEIRRVCTGVDASMDFFKKAARRKADFLICHHGLSWGDSLKRITNLNFRRLKFLLGQDMGLYACHLPLDAHPKLGNNARICKALGLRNIKPFGLYKGITLGFSGSLPGAMSYNEFKKRARAVFGTIKSTMDFGKKRVRTVAAISGGGGELIEEAGQADIDVYVSGEPKLAAYHLAQEYQVNALFAGHYASEVFGVKAVAELLSKRFDIEAEFIETNVPF